MYSFNLDYIFNVVYNILLAIRYAILFWILRISPAEYLEDHKYDAWDGLRDRGWIKFGQASGSANPNSDIIYLGGSSGTEHLSWWDNIKLHVFGIGNNDVGSIASSNSSSYGFNPADVNYAANKTSSDPWFHNLKFSIQNPILSFFADVLTILSFVVFILITYSALKWYFLTITPVSEEKEEAKRKRILEERGKMEKRHEEIESMKVKDASTTAESKEKVIFYNEIESKEEIIESLPAGIPGLPIDGSSLSSKEIKEIKKEQDLLLDYETKNYLPKKENQVLKTTNSTLDKRRNEDVSVKEAAVESIEDKKKKVLEIHRRVWYKERWNRVVGYMEGSEEAVWRVGILEADNLLDDLLSDRGYIGLTMSDKLKQANFNTIDLAWGVHKIRNRIAHDGSRFILTDRMAKNTLEQYKSIFTEFKVFE